MKDVTVYDDIYDVIMECFSDPVYAPTFAKALWVLIEEHSRLLDKESATRQ